jgi:hypothetical protein
MYSINLKVSTKNTTYFGLQKNAKHLTSKVVNSAKFNPPNSARFYYFLLIL